MQCETFEDRLHELLDRRDQPEADAKLQQHALVCDGCAEKLAAQESLFVGLAKTPIPEPSADFTQRVLAGMRSPVRKHRSFRNMTMALMVLAAVLLVALIPAWWLLRGPDGSDEPDQGGALIAGQEPSDAEDSEKASPGDDRESAPDGQGDAPPSESPAPESEGGSETMLAYRNLPSVLSKLPSVGDIPFELPNELPGVDGDQADAIKGIWVDRVATPLKPVTNSVNGAINVLKRTLAVAPAWQPDPDSGQEPQAGMGGPENKADRQVS